MGTTINDLVNENDEFKVTDNLTSADVVLDFSHPTSTKKIINSCLKHNIPMVIGTTGLNKDQMKLLNQLSASLDKSKNYPGTDTFLKAISKIKND